MSIVRGRWHGERVFLTLEDCVKAERDLWAFCRRCGRATRVRTKALVLKRGVVTLVEAARSKRQAETAGPVRNDESGFEGPSPSASWQRNAALRNHPQRRNARKVPIMRYKPRGIHRQCARKLNRVR